MRFLCTIFFAEKKLHAMSDGELQALQDATHAYEDTLRTKGHFIAAQALEPVRTATTLRARDGKVSVTDGPFAETNEQIGGFFVIEAQNLDEAIAVATPIPAAHLGGVEVRAIKPLCGVRSPG